jgi:hypothetical protein
MKMESFESKLKRLGYKLETSDMDSSQFVISPTRAKTVTSVILIIVGMLLMQRLFGPIEYVMSIVNGTSFEGSGLWILIDLLIGTFGALCFYRGSYRFFEFIGFRIVGSQSEVSISRREDLKLERLNVLNPTRFSCDLNGDYVEVTCSNQNDNRIQVIREKNSISDCLPILQELARELDQRIKN